MLAEIFGVDGEIINPSNEFREGEVYLVNLSHTSSKNSSIKVNLSDALNTLATRDEIFVINMCLDVTTNMLEVFGLKNDKKLSKANIKTCPKRVWIPFNDLVSKENASKLIEKYYINRKKYMKFAREHYLG